MIYSILGDLLDLEMICSILRASTKLYPCQIFYFSDIFTLISHLAGPKLQSGP